MNGLKIGGRLIEIEMLRILIALIGTGICTFFDIFNKKNIPDKVLYSFLLISILVNILDPSILIEKLFVGLVLIFALYLFYRVGQIGGADVFVIASIFFSLPGIRDPIISSPPLPEDLLPIKIPSILSILAISAFLFSIFIFVKYLPRIVRKIVRGEIKLGVVNLAQTGLLLIFYLILFIVAWPMIGVLISVKYLLLIGIVVFLMIFFVLFKDDMLEEMIRWRKKVNVEDVIAIEKLDEKIVKKYSIGRLVTKEQLGKMKKLEIRWPVLDLPMFLPFVFISLIIYILFGDILFYPL